MFAGTGVNDPEKWTLAKTQDISSRGIVFSPSGELFMCSEDATLYKMDHEFNFGRYAGLKGRNKDKNGHRLDEAGFCFSNYSYGIAFLPSGEMYLCESTEHRIRLISGDMVLTYTGDAQGYVDGPIAQARFNLPTDIIYFQGQLIVSDGRNRVLRSISLHKGTVSTISLFDNEGACVPTHFQFPFHLTYPVEETVFYVSDLDSDYITEINLQQKTIEKICKIRAPRTVQCLPNGDLIINSYPNGVFYHNRNPESEPQLISAELLGANIYDFAMDLPTGRLATSSNKTRIFLDAFDQATPPLKFGIDLSPMIDRTGDDAFFEPDLKFSLPGKDEAPSLFYLHSHILDLIFSNTPHGTVCAESKENESKLKDEILVKFTEISTKFGNSFTKFFFQVLYGSMSIFKAKSAQEKVPNIMMLIVAFEIMMFDSSPLYETLKQICNRTANGKELSQWLVFAYRSLNSHKSITSILGKSMIRISNYEAMLVSAFGEIFEENEKKFVSSMGVSESDQSSSNNDQSAQNSYDNTSSGRMPLHNALLALADTELELVKGKYDSTVPVPASKVVFTIEGEGDNQVYLQCESSVLYFGWSWYKRLIDSKLSEARTRIVELPSDFPPQLLVLIVYYLYIYHESLTTKELEQLLGFVYVSDSEDALVIDSEAANSGETKVENIKRIETAKYAFMQGDRYELITMEKESLKPFDRLAEWLKIVLVTDDNASEFDKLAMMQILGTSDDVEIAMRRAAIEMKKLFVFRRNGKPKPQFVASFNALPDATIAALMRLHNAPLLNESEDQQTSAGPKIKKKSKVVPMN